MVTMLLLQMLCFTQLVQCFQGTIFITSVGYELGNLDDISKKKRQR